MFQPDLVDLLQAGPDGRRPQRIVLNYHDGTSVEFAPTSSPSSHRNDQEQDHQVSNEYQLEFPELEEYGNMHLPMHHRRLRTRLHEPLKSRWQVPEEIGGPSQLFRPGDGLRWDPKEPSPKPNKRFSVAESLFPNGRWQDGRDPVSILGQSWRDDKQEHESTPQMANPTLTKLPPKPPTTSSILHSKPPPPSGIEPDPSKKVYCTHWIRTGECDFTQQGCKYKHEVPPMPKLLELGFKEEPRWWREKQMLNKARWSLADLQNRGRNTVLAAEGRYEEGDETTSGSEGSVSSGRASPARDFRRQGDGVVCEESNVDACTYQKSQLASAPDEPERKNKQLWTPFTPGRVAPPPSEVSESSEASSTPLGSGIDDDMDLLRLNDYPSLLPSHSTPVHNNEDREPRKHQKDRKIASGPSGAATRKSRRSAHRNERRREQKGSPSTTRANDRTKILGGDINPTVEASGTASKQVSQRTPPALIRLNAEQLRERRLGRGLRSSRYAVNPTTDHMLSVHREKYPSSNFDMILDGNQRYISSATPVPRNGRMGLMEDVSGRRPMTRDIQQSG